MPELPEVETVMRGMAKVMTGQRLTRVDVLRKKLRRTIPRALPTLAGARIDRLERRAKYILVFFDRAQVMILHLGMTGRVTINPPAPAKHDHIVFTLASGDRLVFNDPRRFGLVDLADANEMLSHALLAHLGPEPFDAVFTPAHLCAALERRKGPLKPALMDQRVVVGVGNIYAAEALYRARISPLRRACDLDPAEAKRLIPAIRAVLQQSIDAGGSSLRDYVQADGGLGYYQDQWKVYGRGGEACLRRGCGGQIMRIVQAGRATFYCPDCQK